jgi:hypothetical protein
MKIALGKFDQSSNLAFMSNWSARQILTIFGMMYISNMKHLHPLKQFNGIQIKIIRCIGKSGPPSIFLNKNNIIRKL